MTYIIEIGPVLRQTIEGTVIMGGIILVLCVFTWHWWSR